MGLTLCDKYGYGNGHLLNDLCSAFWFTYSLIFYGKVINLLSVYAGAIMLIGQVADALAMPLVGVLQDRTSLFIEYGKLKMWHLVGTIGVFLTFPLIYSPCILCHESQDWKKFVYYSVFVVLFQFSWALVQIAHLALVPELTGEEAERTDLFSYRNSFTYLSSMMVYGLTWAVLEMRKDSSKIVTSDVYKFQAIAFTICTIGAASTLTFHMIVQEPPPKSQQPTEDGNPVRVRLGQREIFSKCLFYQAALVYACARTFCNVSQTFVNLYLHEDLELGKETIAIIPLVIFSSSFLVSWVTTLANRVLGRKIAFVTGCSLGLGACLWIFLGKSYIYKTYFIYCVSFLLGASYSLQMVTSLAVTTDLIGNDTGNSAFVFGLVSFCEKLANGIIIMVIQSLAPHDSESTMFYRNSIVIVCSVSCTIGIICALTIK